MPLMSPNQCELRVCECGPRATIQRLLLRSGIATPLRATVTRILGAISHLADRSSECLGAHACFAETHNDLHRPTRQARVEQLGHLVQVCQALTTKPNMSGTCAKSQNKLGRLDDAPSTRAPRRAASSLAAPPAAIRRARAIEIDVPRRGSILARDGGGNVDALAA